MNRMNVSCLRLQSYGDICHLPNNFSEKAETYSDTRANMRQKGTQECHFCIFRLKCLQLSVILYIFAENIIMR
jgi:hypothetical protein